MKIRNTRGGGGQSLKHGHCSDSQCEIIQLETKKQQQERIKAQQSLVSEDQQECREIQSRFRVSVLVFLTSKLQLLYEADEICLR